MRDKATKTLKSLGNSEPNQQVLLICWSVRATIMLGTARECLIMEEGNPPSYGGYRYDIERGDFIANDGEICRLRRRSFQVLRYLADHSSQVVTKDELLDKIWHGAVVTDDSLTQCISEIRKALSDKDFTVVKTIPRRGYILNPDPELVSEVTHLRSSYKHNNADHLSPNFKFIVGPPVIAPESFFGRYDLLSRIFAQWQQPPFGHISIVGPRRSGKTSLLRHLQPIGGPQPFTARRDQPTNRLLNATEFRWVYIDFQDPRMRSLPSLLQHILLQLGHQPPPICTIESFMDLATETKWTTPTVFLIDELEAGLAADELDQAFWWSMRALTQMTDGLIAMVLSSYQHPMLAADNQDKASPFFNIFTSLELGPFTEPEAFEYIDSVDQPYADSDRDWILQHSERWPCLLQLLCQEKYFAQTSKADQWREQALQQRHKYTDLLQ